MKILPLRHAPFAWTISLRQELPNVVICFATHAFFGTFIRRAKEKKPQRISWQNAPVASI
jgi:hypothetical protein